MKGILLDTHAFLWFATGDEDLSVVARDAITTTSEVFVSAASAWEVRAKYRLGKLSSAAVLAHDLAAAVRRLELTELPITFADGDLAGALAGTHRDPCARFGARRDHAIRRGVRRDDPRRAGSTRKRHQLSPTEGPIHRERPRRHAVVGVYSGGGRRDVQGKGRLDT